MKIIHNIRLLSLICFAMSIGIATSCNKEKDAGSGNVVLLSFGPSGVKHGDQIKFIGMNMNKVTSIKLVGDSIPGSLFVEQTPELIVIVVPEKAERGLIILRTPEGNIVSKTVLDLEVPVTITSIPASVRPGDNITIKGTYLNWIKEIWFTKDILVRDSDFVSKSLTELVVKVPLRARTGSLLFNTGGTAPLSIISENDLGVVLPSFSGFSPIPLERGGNLTITGTNLDLTEGILFKGVSGPVTEFVSKSATTIIVTVPQSANRGIITLVAYSGITVASTENLRFVGELPDLAPLGYAFYTDALQNGWGNWGWGCDRDFANTENVRAGDASIKVTYTGGGGLYFGGGNVAINGYTELTFSVFGTPGTAGKQIEVKVNWGTAYVITIEEGVWVEYKLTMANIGNPTQITDLAFQNKADWLGTIYVDYVGLR